MIVWPFPVKKKTKFSRSRVEEGRPTKDDLMKVKKVRSLLGLSEERKKANWLGPLRDAGSQRDQSKGTPHI